MVNVLRIYTDGGARGNPGPAACAFVIISDGKIIHKDTFFLGIKTNNEAEYNGVLYALKWISGNTKKIENAEIIFYLDSELVTRQLSGIYKIKNENLIKLFSEIKNIEKYLSKNISYKSVKREANKIADRLVNIKLDENI